MPGPGNRRGGAARGALIAAVALVAVTAAVWVGIHVSGNRTLPALSRSGDTNYARNALGIGHLTPVDANFVASRVGAIPGVAPQMIVGPATPPRGHTTPTTVAADESIHGAPGTFGLSPGNWALTLQMVPDRDTVKAGDELRYRMIITNVGSAPFGGRNFTLNWDTPNGTIGRNSLQQCDLVSLLVLRAICSSQRVVISPGLGDVRPEKFNSSGLVAIGPHQEWAKDWYVEILPSNAAGSTIFNHAILTVNVNGQQQTIRTPDVVVTVVA